MILLVLQTRTYIIEIISNKCILWIYHSYGIYILMIEIGGRLYGSRKNF